MSDYNSSFKMVGSIDKQKRFFHDFLGKIILFFDVSYSLDLFGIRALGIISTFYFYVLILIYFVLITI